MGPPKKKEREKMMEGERKRQEWWEIRGKDVNMRRKEKGKVMNLKNKDGRN